MLHIRYCINLHMHVPRSTIHSGLEFSPSHRQTNSVREHTKKPTRFLLNHTNMQIAEHVPRANRLKMKFLRCICCAANGVRFPITVLKYLRSGSIKANCGYLLSHKIESRPTNLHFSLACTNI